MDETNYGFENFELTEKTLKQRLVDKENAMQIPQSLHQSYRNYIEKVELSFKSIVVYSNGPAPAHAASFCLIMFDPDTVFFILTDITLAFV